MIVDCLTCPMRRQRCQDCVVTVLFAPGSAELTPTERPSPTELLLDAAENRAVSIFVGAGLVDAEAAAGLCARREALEHSGVCAAG